MGCVFANVFRCHPGFLIGVIEGVPVQLDVSRDDEPINVVGGHCYLHLGRGLRRLIDQDGHLLPVCDGLAALSRPNEESFVCVDVAGNVSKCQRGHG